MLCGKEGQTIAMLQVGMLRGCRENRGHFP